MIRNRKHLRREVFRRFFDILYSTYYSETVVNMPYDFVVDATSHYGNIPTTSHHSAGPLAHLPEGSPGGLHTPYQLLVLGYQPHSHPLFGEVLYVSNCMTHLKRQAPLPAKHSY